MIENEVPIVAFFKQVLDPLLIWGLLVFMTWAFDEEFTGYYLVLLVITFFVSTYIFEQTSNYGKWRKGHMLAYMRDTLFGWLIVVVILLFLNYAADFSHHFSEQVVVSWFIATPIGLMANHVLMSKFVDRSRRKGGLRSAVVVGANETSLTLVQNVADYPHLSIDFRGYFEDRGEGRRIGGFGPHLGDLKDVADYVRKNHTDMIFISLPMSAQPRIRDILDQLHDATASIYFLPDVHIFDLMQAHFNSVGGVPVVAICDSPYVGIDQILKSVSDFVLASLILLVTSPILLTIAVLIKVTSPGPVMFRQRRYGLNGEEILVCKFRTMTVTEDGAKIEQAHLNDPRITRVGAFLRRTSLDELPQFINVLQGKMSIVGPRPHAVAHNELYRKLIRGYMLRHKVKPGITGWAQVNGLRGETETLEKMQARIEYDLAYLKNWSLSLDLWIILLTIGVVLKRDNAH
jgi:putative colanic acid biosynthesis UDP-glucose lipid carrier transferase